MRLEGVGFRYGRGEPWVLDEVTAAIEPGEAVVLDGRNGVGKSTLLRLVAGVLPPTRGRITGRPRLVAWVPERFPANQPFTVRQYLDAVAGMRGLSVPAADKAVTRWLERLGIAGFADSRLADLSKGTVQKVGIAQALLVPPDLLVLDEPWEGLDRASFELVPTFVAEVLADGGSAVVSDHRGEAARLPGSSAWRLDATGFHTAPPAAAETCLIEVEVDATAAASVAALLRDAGHENVRVRTAVTR